VTRLTLRGHRFGHRLRPASRGALSLGRDLARGHVELHSTCGADGQVARKGSSVPRSQHRVLTIAGMSCLPPLLFHAHRPRPRTTHCSLAYTHPPPADCSCPYSGLDIVAVYEAETSHYSALGRRRSACPFAAGAPPACICSALKGRVALGPALPCGSQRCISGKWQRRPRLARTRPRRRLP